MTKKDFGLFWRRIVDKFPKHFTDKAQETREFNEWYGIFSNHNPVLFERAMGLWLLESGEYFPKISEFKKLYMRAYKDQGESENKEPILPVIQKFTRIAADPRYGELMIDLQGTVRDEKVPRGHGDFSSMAECLLNAYKVHIAAPALQDHKKQETR